MQTVSDEFVSNKVGLELKGLVCETSQPDAATKFMNLDISGRKVLVTGGSHGIGLATAKLMAAEGCDVAICSRTPQRLEDAVTQISAFGGRTLSFECDVLDPRAPDHVMDEIEDTWGGIHILVNNVGGGGRWGKESVEETAPMVWGEVYQKNAGAAIAFTRRAIPFMRKENGVEWCALLRSTARQVGDALGSTWRKLPR